MYYDDLKQLVEKYLFKEAQAKEKEYSELSRKIYSQVMPHFPSFKLVNFKKEGEKLSCLGYFENRYGKHLVNFFGKVNNDNDVEIPIEPIKNTLSKLPVEEPSIKEVQIGEIISKNKEKISSIVSLFNSINFKCKYFSILDDVLDYDLESTLIRNMLLSFKAISEGDVIDIIKGTFLEMGYVVDLDKMIDLLQKVKEKFSSLPQRGKFMKIPYDIPLIEGGTRRVMVHIYYDDNLDDLDKMMVFFTNEKDEEISELVDYSLDKTIKADIVTRIKKEAESGISVPLGYQPTSIRVNKAFLPCDLDVGDTIVLDGVKYKVINKDENKLSTIGEGSYFVLVPVFEDGGKKDDK